MRGTCQTRCCLERVGCLTHQERTLLEKNYAFLRNIEHRLQIMFDLQTHELPADPRERLKWVEFKQPRYDGQGALIETGIMHGPLAGIGYECRVRSGVAGWTVGECRTTWIS